MADDGFLNPKSMLTPAAAGATVMGISNALWVSFSFPPPWVALALSFIIVAPIILRFNSSILEKISYFILNGLFIFSIAIGTNSLGKTINRPNESNESTDAKHHYRHRSYKFEYKAEEPKAPPPQSKEFFSDWLQYLR